MSTGDSHESGSGGPCRPAHIISFDVEEYFHAEAAAIGGLRPDQWSDYPQRAEPCVDRILSMLAEHGATATFFVLGWVARQRGDMVRRIADAGHEVASHGMAHSMIGRLSPDEFRADVTDSRKLLEDIAGQAVLGYRAPTFSITHKTAWAIDILAEAGYGYDSSIFPVHHDRYGVPEAPSEIHHAVGPAADSSGIVEIPPLVLRALGKNLPVAGGGYLRLFPVWLVKLALRQAEKHRRPGMIYLHPWELDPDQGELPMSRMNRWRHRVNLSRTEGKLRSLLVGRRFVSACQFLADLDTDLPSFAYGATAEH